MRETGIIRRVDSLGRIAIPKAIREKLEIEDNQPMEIFLDCEGRVIFQKVNMEEE